jgi:NAD(P)-dependent dehydrogenase (short-subunit alcohol dehydrogenase family)
MDERLAGDLAVVTGGGAGIGEAASLRLADAGADVVAVDRDGQAAEGTATAVEDRGQAGFAVEADVGDEDAVAGMADRVSGEFGRVDVVINNAAIRVDPKPVTEANEASWDRILDVNLKGTAFCSKHLIPLMAEDPRRADRTDRVDDAHPEYGAVVNVASVGAHWARPAWSQYDATKGGIVSMTRDMACDHANDGIRVNAVSPGWVITDYHTGDRTGEEAEQFLRDRTTRGGHDESILRRAAEPAELADAILFLASAESSFVTGVNVPVDGGASVV